MTAPLSRAAGRGRPAPPVRLVHLGLGNFFRAHQAWYTEHAPDAEQWGIAAFAGRGSRLAETLDAQDGLYTLVTRAAAGDRFDVIGSVSRAHVASDHDAWLGYFASPQVRAVTVTITEAGYLRGADGALDRTRDDVQADVASLRRDPTARVLTAPARLVAGLAARRRADAGPLTLIPCDNLPDNGAVAARVVTDLADMVDPGLADWSSGSLSTVTTMVDRITPRTAPEDLVAVSESTGLRDDAPVVTEPFREWVISGDFPAGRPRWEDAGATFTDDITPFEHRKLWLLNGGHSLLAYAGAVRGHDTVAEAVADDTVRGWLAQWWTEASGHLSQGEGELAAYRTALLDRFANPRIRYLLAQIATDGSQKLPVRILPTLRQERAAGRTPAGASLVLGAWVLHLRGAGTPVADVRADEIVPLASGPLPNAVERVLTYLDPALGADTAVVSAVLDAAEQLGRPSPA
jgi:fructuronate reductase